MPVSEHVGEFIVGGPSVEQLQPTRPAVTPQDQAESAHRDAVRRHILAHAEHLVDEVLNTPVGQFRGEFRVLADFAAAVRPTINRYRSSRLPTTKRS